MKGSNNLFDYWKKGPFYSESHGNLFRHPMEIRKTNFKDNEEEEVTLSYNPRKKKKRSFSVGYSKVSQKVPRILPPPRFRGKATIPQPPILPFSSYRSEFSLRRSPIPHPPVLPFKEYHSNFSMRNRKETNWNSKNKMAGNLLPIKGSVGLNKRLNNRIRGLKSARLTVNEILAEHPSFNREQVTSTVKKHQIESQRRHPFDPDY
jgi:hypothetical protein